MANLKNTTIDDIGHLTLPVGTTVQRPTSPTAGMVRYNSDSGQTEYYDGITWRSISDTSVEATGGTIADTEIGGVPYRIHLFTTAGSSTFTVTKGGEVEYLIVAGGGGGGPPGGGGGGAGGVLTGFTTLLPQTYTITVGTNGDGGVYLVRPGGSGGNSSAFGLTAIGGGGGGGNNLGATSGGSGGGQSGNFTGSAPGTGTTGQGNSGGNGNNSTFQTNGGGGGAGTSGESGNGIRSGNGGSGVSSLIAGTINFYGGGGGGGGGSGASAAAGIGGLGGGGSGSAGDVNASPGIANTGGGGGGRGNGGSPGGVGGSGIVIVRYRRNASTTTAPSLIITGGVQKPRAAPNAEWIMNYYPGSPDGVYLIDLPTVGITPIYCILNRSIAGGGWMLAMKATKGTTFSYESNYWTTTNTLNPDQTNRNDGDAKYQVFNYHTASQFLAWFPQNSSGTTGPNNGGMATGFGAGWHWLVSGQNSTALNRFQTSTQIVSNPRDAGSSWNGSGFSNQGGYQSWDFNYTGNTNGRVRWGFGWNNETDQGSNDVSGGIGMTPTYGGFSAGDRINCCQIVTGFNTSCRVEIWVK